MDIQRDGFLMDKNRMNKLCLHLITTCILTLMLVTIAAPLAHADITSNLILHYTLDDNAASTPVIDSQALSNGTATANTSVLHVAGTIGTGAFAFATSSAQNVNTNYVWSATDSSFTISLWVNFHFFSPTTEVFITNSHGQKGAMDLQFNNGNRPQCQIVDTGTQSLNVIATSTSAGDDTWHLITCVLNGTTAHVYNNGVEVGTGSNASLNGNYRDATNQSLHLAWNNSASSYTGMLDDVCIYNRALSSADVLQLFQSTTGCATAAPSSTNFYKLFIGLGSVFGVMGGGVFKLQ